MSRPSERVADLFEKKRPQMERAFKRPVLRRGAGCSQDAAQYLYVNVQRGAREVLEQRGTLLLLPPPPPPPPRKSHANGVEWIFWAEEPVVEANGE